MTNKMKLILKTSLILSGACLIVSLVSLFIKSVGYLNVISYLILGISLVLFIVLLSIFITIKVDEKRLRQQIAYYRLLKNLRNKAVLDFYKRFGIKPQYDKDGKLITPDELLGILTSLDKDGKLNPAIYERLGILPVFDKDGKEIPTILVLKHLIKAIKSKELEKINKLKGLYKKGTKQDNKSSQKDLKQTTQKKKEESKSKKKSKSDAFKFFKGTKYEPKRKDSNKKSDKTPENKPSTKIEQTSIKQEVKQTLNQNKPIITKIKEEEIKELGGGYLSRMGSTENEKPAEGPQKVSNGKKEEFGECTPE